MQRQRGCHIIIITIILVEPALMTIVSSFTLVSNLYLLRCKGMGWKELAGCKRHILGHGLAKQYVCGLPLKSGSTCTFSSNHSATMYAHRKGGKHVPYEGYEFACEVCSKKFPMRQGLDRHMKSHQQKKRSFERRAAPFSPRGRRVAKPREAHYSMSCKFTIDIAKDATTNSANQNNFPTRHPA